MMMKRSLLAALLVLSSARSLAGADSYTLDPGHTYPSFEASHMGVSLWRGKVNKSSGKVVLDRAAKSGTVTVEIDAKSIDFGHDKMNEHALSEDFFNVEKHPLITFRSSSVEFEGDSPKSVQGDLTLLGVTRPVTLSISAFNCRIHPINKKYVCGADASTAIKRSDFGITYAIPGVSDEVKLFIQVEAFKDGQ